MRRVVTGHTPDGKAIVASDTKVDPITVALIPESEYYRLWGSDETLIFPDDGSPRSSHAYFPPVGGFRFGLFTVPPQTAVSMENIDIAAAILEVREKLPGLLKYMEQGQSGFHTTDTIDFEYVISGEVWLELDDGKEVHLRPGDTIVQNGTRHAWRNKGSEPCRMVCCMVGAYRAH